MNCPNCDVEPRTDFNEFCGVNLICPKCRMWTNWQKNLNDAWDVWNAQVKDVLKRGGHLKWRQAHPA